MCLLGLVFQQIPHVPVFVVGNREETRTRPTADPHITTESNGVQWFGGRDLLAGGTWLGVNQTGLLAAVTNRPASNPPAHPRSRGMLCRELLAATSAIAATDWALKAVTSRDYLGCNLLLADRQSAHVIEAADQLKTHGLHPGIHVIANGRLNDPADSRVRRARASLQSVADADLPTRIAAAKTLCGLPATGDLPAICRPGADWGTVSSTIIAMTTGAQQSAYWYAAGPPSQTQYVDYSPSFRRLISTRRDMDS